MTTCGRVDWDLRRSALKPLVTFKKSCAKDSVISSSQSSLQRDGHLCLQSTCQRSCIPRHCYSQSSMHFNGPEMSFPLARTIEFEVLHYDDHGPRIFSATFLFKARVDLDIVFQLEVAVG